MSQAVNLQSTLTCPKSGHQETDTMPVDSCQWHYECKACGAVLRLEPGGCCVTCSHDAVRRLSIQQRDSSCCLP